MNNGLPPIMKKGCWESGPTEFGSFEFKGETIVIDSEEKYLYWDKKLDIQNDDKDINEMVDNNDPNFAKLWHAMEAFLFITHRIDIHHWDGD